ncbi:AAA family ATPase [Paraburkholderia aromaticivorans]|uniref:AAA family ATPase n=1 Tax=Paraburkholderia aromaticivorans TaxID=2026199 RepID=UPI0038BCE460
MKLERFKTFTTKHAGYQKENIAYNLIQLEREIIHRNPNVNLKNINLDDYKELAASLPFAPSWHGGLSESLGVKKKVLTVELWDKIFHSWAPAENLEADSPLHALVEDTPAGPMVRMNKSATAFNEDGTFATVDKPHRAVTEGLFTLGKGVSVWFLSKAAEDPEILTKLNKLHQRIMDQYVIPAMTEDARIRLGKDGIILKQGLEIAVASFMHIDNRPSENETDGEKRKKAQQYEGTPEPHIHWHVAAVNSCMGADGKLYTLNTDLLFPNKSWYSTLYMGPMMQALQEEHGLKFQPVYASSDLNKPVEERTIVSYDVTDDIVPENVRDYFSSRSNNMKESIKKKGLELTHGAMDIAQKQLKQGKIEMSPSEMIQSWKQQCDDLGYHPSMAQLDYDQVKPKNPPIDFKQLVINLHTRRHYLTMERVHNAIKRLRKSKDAKPKDLEDVSDQQIIQDFHNHHKEYAFKESQFKAYVVVQLLNKMSMEDAHAHADRLFQQECELQLDNSISEQYQDFLAGKIPPEEHEQFRLRFMRDASFTSKWMKQVSKDIVEICNSRKDETQFVLNEAMVIDAIIAEEERMSRELGIDFKMSAGQRDGILGSTTKPGATFVLEGLPGTGKSTAAKVIYEVYKNTGFNVCGTSIGSAATENLGKACGMKPKEYANATILLMELDSGKRKWDSKSVCLIDEAGMADAQTLNRLVKHAQKTGAKLVPIGDHFQLAPVGAGGLFQHMVELYPTVALTEINRQRNVLHREIAMDIHAKDAKKALHTMYDNGMIVITDTNEQAMDALVKDFVDDPANLKDRKSLAGLNEDCDTINQGIRAELQKRGMLTTNEAEQITVKCRDGATRVFAPGDRIVVDKNEKSDDIKAVRMMNSNTGTVEKVIRNTKGKIIAMSVKLDSKDDPIIINVDKRKPPIRLGYIQTIHGSQGATYENTFGYVSNNMHCLNEIFVMATRHKGNFKLYVSREQQDKLLEQAADLAPTEKQVQTVRWLAIKNNLEIPPDAILTFGGARAFLDEHHYNIGDNKKLKHPMDDFLDLIQQYSKLSLKKSHLDYTELQNHRPEYVAFQEQVKRELAEFEAQKRFAKFKKAMGEQEQRIEVPAPVQRPAPSIIPKQRKGKQKGSELTI